LLDKVSLMFYRLYLPTDHHIRHLLKRI
jgi:hypothetical protein